MTKTARAISFVGWAFYGFALAQAPSTAAQAVPLHEVQFPSAQAGVILTAYWTPPPDSAKAQAGGAATVIALHGCNGLLADKSHLGYPWNRYVKIWHDAGMGVLYVDSFGSRGLGDLCAVKPSLRTVQEWNRRLDVVGALQWLAAQPGVDRQRLGVVGWSHGGQTVLAVANGAGKDMQSAPIKPAALVAFYPGCSTVGQELGPELSAPLLIMSGELDNWTPALPCKSLAERLQAQHQAVRYVQHPGSYHAFDSVAPVTERTNAGGTKTGRAMAGGNPAARNASAIEMMRFLGQHLGVAVDLAAMDESVHASPVPPPSGYAALEDASRLPKVSAVGQGLYLEWLSKPFPRAVAISSQGALARGYGRMAMEVALTNCEKFSKPCRLYAVDDVVVWTTP